MISGMLLIDKPVGWTSFDIVAKIRSIVSADQKKRVKVGHSGTLDPFASGLLLIFIGTYTKRVQEFTKLDKTYEVEMKLGEVSTTGDPEGLISIVSKRIPTKKEILEALTAYSGDYLQDPPIFSAIKINGQRSYDLARKGEAVKLEPRPVRVYQNSLLSYKYPIVRFSSSVSSGTYIRSLVEDIGEKLAVGAYSKVLIRSKVGLYDIKDATKIEDCSLNTIINNLIELA